MTDFRLPPDRIWMPDLLLYNSASQGAAFDPTHKANVLVYSNGRCEYIPPGVFSSTCEVTTLRVRAMNNEQRNECLRST